MTDRLRRSLLYTPADDPDMMASAASLDAADGVIFDLEDAVPAEDVPAARRNLETVLDEHDFGETETCVRINGLQTDKWRADVDAAVRAGVDTIVLPMVEGPDHLDMVVSEAVPSTTGIELVPTIETPRGAFAADDIAERGRELDAVTALSYGIGDYARALGTTGSPEAVHEYLQQVVVSAAALGGLDPIATVYQDYDDTEGLRAAARSARDVGYIGQKAIHPKQLEVLNDMYSLTETELEDARTFVEAFEKADRDSIVVDGVFLDTAVVEQYRTILSRHEEVAE
jgi:citrate lyase subunit beta/citryl-CoA lyase